MKKIANIALGVYAIATTIFCFYLTSPLNDHGHRLYGVNSKKAQKTIDKIFVNVAGLKRQMVFKAGCTTQAIYDNGSVGTNLVDSIENTEHLLATAPSFVVQDPIGSANAAAKILNDSGYTARVVTKLDKSLGENKIAMVITDAAPGWILVFRRHLVMMGSQPKDIGINY